MGKTKEELILKETREGVGCGVSCCNGGSKDGGGEKKGEVKNEKERKEKKRRENKRVYSEFR